MFFGVNEIDKHVRQTEVTWGMNYCLTVATIQSHNPFRGFSSGFLGVEDSRKIISFSVNLSKSSFASITTTPAALPKASNPGFFENKEVDFSLWRSRKLLPE